ncbi:major facilitator superfamily domain-containing protein [Sporodiniella umbellata]|nr:major facilitator superfamily domain-containing protein [Sporodiniella umbellata]
MSNELKQGKLLKSKWMIKPPVDSDPRLLSDLRKNVILLSISLCASTSGFSSTIYFPGLPAVTSDLSAPPIATTLTTALFILIMGIAPIFWAALSDYYQIRRVLFLLSMLIFAVSSLGCALVNNIWALVVLRCIQSIGSSCATSVGAGVVSDCYPVEKRGAAFGKYFFGFFFGPLLGPILGGFLIMSPLSWRATFWFCFALSLFIFVLVFFALPETYRVDARFPEKLPVVVDKAPSLSSTDTVEKASDEKETALNITEQKEQDQAVIRKRINPFAPFYMLKHPAILLASLSSGIAFGCMFATETITPDLYETHYGFDSWKTGLSYLGGGLGNVMGAIVSGNTSDRLMLLSRKKRGGKIVTEDRLTLTVWPGIALFLPFGLLLFGWTIVYNKSVWAPIVGFGCLNFGMNLVMASTSAYLVDSFPGKGASVTAASSFVRMTLACVLTLASNPMVIAIGAGWTTLFLSVLCIVGTLLLLLLKVKGHAMRERVVL